MEEHRFAGTVVAGTLIAEVVLVLLVGEGRELVSAALVSTASAALDAVPTAPDCIAAAWSTVRLVNSAALDSVPTAPDCIAAA